MSADSTNWLDDKRHFLEASVLCCAMRRRGSDWLSVPYQSPSSVRRWLGSEHWIFRDVPKDSDRWEAPAE